MWFIFLIPTITTAGTPMFEILVIVIDSMCGDAISDLLYLAIPTVLLGAGAFFLIGKDNQKKIVEIFR